MKENIEFTEREARLLHLTSSAKRLNKDALLQILAVADTEYQRLRMALNIYLWTCLSEAFPDKSFRLSDDMLRDYEQDIVRMPNVTPNGLVLPKAENMLAFNLLQKETGAAFSKLGMGNDIARIQYPVNVRLQSGRPDAAIDNRPRASVKPHSDIWAGDPASGILVFLSLLGDTKHSGIRFFQPRQFPKSFVRTLEDYNDGAPLMEGAKELARFDESGWFLADPYILHKTTKNGGGFRISLDFRFIPKTAVSSDTDEDATRKPFFIGFDEWAKLGDSTLIATKERMSGFSADRKKDPYTIGYPVKIFLLDIGQANDAQYKKIAS